MTSGKSSLPPATIFLFGAHGDLVRRLLVPALYRLACAGHLPDDVDIVGVDHNDATDEQFRSRLGDFMLQLAADPCAEGGGEPVKKRQWARFAQRLSYLKGDFLEHDTYEAIKKRLGKAKSGNAIFYLATSPRFFADVATQLSQAGLLEESSGAYRRLVVEKPFGTDLQSACALNGHLLGLMDESSIYRIDHFMGKDAVRGILAARLGVPWMEAFWNRHYIDHVQITAAETLGVEGRGKFYEGTGALRDMVPNHLFQLLAMVAMEPPAATQRDSLRDESATVLGAIRRITPRQAAAHSVRGQYRAGRLDGQRVPGYRSEPGVARSSNTETFAALKLYVDTWRWADVPFYLRTGKRMSTRATEIALHFRPTPITGGIPVDMAGSGGYLTLRIDPEAEIAFDLQAKVPGPQMKLGPVRLRYAAADHFTLPTATGYESLLYGCLCGDQTLFQRADAIEAAWRAVEPFQQAWGRDDAMQPYAAGNDGPAAAKELINKDGYNWHEI